MSPFTATVASVQARIRAACTESGRSVLPQLVAVTKTRAPGDLAHLAALGLHHYGENRVDHLEQMAANAPDGSVFHYIGRVQSRQFPSIVRHCRVLHSLAKVDHVPKLANACRDAGTSVQVYCQVNTSGEAVKAGIGPSGLPAMLAACSEHGDVIEVQGLMTMAPDLRQEGGDTAAVRVCFQGLADLARAHGLGGLSMGMSGDFTLAIAAGSTCLRIGGALYGDA